MKKIFNRMKAESMKTIVKAKIILADKRGETYIDTVVKILIAVVLGALLLAGLYALFGETVLPELQRRISEMFSYNG